MCELNNTFCDEVIFFRGGISFITEPTPRDLVMGDKCATLSTGHVMILHEQRTPCMIEATFQWVFRLHTFYWHIIKRVDSRLCGDVGRSRRDPHTLSRLRVSETHLFATFKG